VAERWRGIRLFKPHWFFNLVDFLIESQRLCF